MARVFTTGPGPHHRHPHHYRFWLLLAASIAILLSTHFALFQTGGGRPHDAITSPDAVLIAVVAAGLVLLGALLHSEVRDRKASSKIEQKEKPRRAA
jgi:hypothetical protein